MLLARYDKIEHIDGPPDIEDVVVDSVDDDEEEEEEEEEEEKAEEPGGVESIDLLEKTADCHLGVPPTFDAMQEKHGLAEIGHRLFKKTPSGEVGDAPIGYIEIMHGSTMSLKAVCLHAEHLAPSSSSSAGAPKRRKYPCYLLMGAMRDFWPKYEHCLEWLCNQDCDATEHLVAAARTREHWLST